MTGRSVVAPVSPLLVAPVMRLYGQAAGEAADAADVDIEWGDVEAAEDEAIALIVEGVAILGVTGLEWIVGVLAGGVGVDVVRVCDQV